MKKWNEPDPVSSEEELKYFLFALVRMLKPDLIVETGCYKGHMTDALAMACHLNEYGRVVACDTDPLMVQITQERCEQPVTVRRISSLELPELREADFIFSDSDYRTRPLEIAAAKKGAVIVVHDTSRESHRYDPEAPFLGDVVKQYGGLLFDAGRGFGIIVKA